MPFPRRVGTGHGRGSSIPGDSGAGRAVCRLGASERMGRELGDIRHRPRGFADADKALQKILDGCRRPWQADLFPLLRSQGVAELLAHLPAG